MKLVNPALIVTSASVRLNLIRNFSNIPYRSHENVVSVSAPASHGSLGDEALLLGAQESLRLAGKRFYGLVDGDPWPWIEAGASTATDENLSAHASGLLMKKQVFSSLIPGQQIVVLGADFVDGAYGIRGLAKKINMLNAAARLGKKSVLANFSMREEPNPDAIRLLKLLDPMVQLFARDKLSAARAQSRLNRDVQAFPDAAMYLPAGRHREIFEYCKNAEDPIAVLVPNAHLSSLHDVSWSQLVQLHAQTVDLLVRSGHRVIVLAHDIRESPGDPLLVESIVNSSSASPERIAKYIPKTAAEAKSVIGCASVAIVERMHAAVAALSQQVPTLGLEYVGKFSGQFDWYGPGNKVVPWEQICSPTEIVNEIGNLSVKGTEATRDNSYLPVATLPAWIE